MSVPSPDYDGFLEWVESAMDEPLVIEVSPAAFEALLLALDLPPEENERLRELFARESILGTPERPT